MGLPLRLRFTVASLGLRELFLRVAARSVEQDGVEDEGRFCPLLPTIHEALHVANSGPGDAALQLAGACLCVGHVAHYVSYLLSLTSACRCGYPCQSLASARCGFAASACCWGVRCPGFASARCRGFAAWALLLAAYVVGVSFPPPLLLHAFLADRRIHSFNSNDTSEGANATYLRTEPQNASGFETTPSGLLVSPGGWEPRCWRFLADTN